MGIGLDKVAKYIGFSPGSVLVHVYLGHAGLLRRLNSKVRRRFLTWSRLTRLNTVTTYINHLMTALCHGHIVSFACIA